MNGKNSQAGGKAAPPAMSKEDEAGLRAILRRKEEEVKQLLAPEKGMRDIDALAKKIVTEVKALESKGGEDGAENSEFTYLAAVETPPQFNCPTCGNREQTNFVLDQKQGDTICLGADGGGCGTVVQDHKVHEGSMYRKFEGEADRSHHGPAPNRLYSTAHNMRTWISDGNDAARLRNLAEEVEMGLSNVGKEERKTRTAYKDQMKREAFDLVNHIAANCDLHETVVVRAKELFAGWRNVKEHVNQKHAVICACIVAAFREVSTHELSRQFLLRKRERPGEEIGAEDDEDPLYPFVCAECKAGFNAIKALDAHRKEVHKATLPGKWSQELLDSLSKFPAKRRAVATFTEPRLRYYANWTITEAREWLNSTVNKLELPATYVQTIGAAIEKSATSQGAAQQRAGVKRQRSVTRTPGQILMLMSLNRLTELCGGGAKGAKDAAKLHQEIGLKRAERDRAKKARKADNNEAQRKHQNVRKPWVAHVDRQLKSETEAEEKLAKAGVATAASVASAATTAPTPAPPPLSSVVAPTLTLAASREAAAPVTPSPGVGTGAVPTMVSVAPAAAISEVAVVNPPGTVVLTGASGAVVVNPPGTVVLTGASGAVVSAGAGYGAGVAGSVPSNSTGSVQIPHSMATQSPEVINVMATATDAFAQIHPSTSAQPTGLTETMSSVSTGYSESTQRLSGGTRSPIVATGYMGMTSSTTPPTGEVAGVASTVSTEYKDVGQSGTAQGGQVTGTTSSGGAGYIGMSTSTASQVPNAIGGMSANSNGYMEVAPSAMEVAEVSAPETSVAEVGYVTMASPATQMAGVSGTVTSVADSGYVAMTSATMQMTDISGTTSSVAGTGYVGMASPATQVTDVSGSELTASTGYVGVTPSGSTGPTTYGEVAQSTTAPQSDKAAGTIPADPNDYIGVASSSTTQPTEMAGGDQTLYVGMNPSTTEGSEVAGAMSTDATTYVGITPLGTGQSSEGMSVMPSTGYTQLASTTNAQAGEVGQTGSTSSAGFMAATSSTAAPVSAMEGAMSIAPVQYVGVSPSPATGTSEVTGTLPAAATGYTGVAASPASSGISGTMSTGTVGYATVSPTPAPAAAGITETMTSTVSTGYTDQAIEMGSAMSTTGVGYAELTPASVGQAAGVPGTVSSLHTGYLGLTSPAMAQSGEMPGALLNATTGYVGVTSSGTADASGIVGAMSTVGTRYAGVASSPGIVGVADAAAAGAAGYVGVTSSPAPVATGGLVSMPGIASGYMGMVPSTTVQSTAAPGPVIVDLTEPTPIYQS